MDLIRELAEMALGSRLKRLTQRFNRGVSAIYAELEVDFEPRWFPLTYLLYQRGPLAVTESAETLGFTHTAIKKFADEMARRGLLQVTRDPEDNRRRVLRLSAKGRRLCEFLLPVWRQIAAAAYELILTAKPNLLAALDAVEEQLDREEYYDRLKRHLSMEVKERCR